MAEATPRQRRQWELRQVLGSVTGLPRWNRATLERLKYIKLSECALLDVAVAMAQLEHALAKAEQEIRYGLKHIPKPPVL